MSHIHFHTLILLLITTSFILLTSASLSSFWIQSG